MNNDSLPNVWDNNHLVCGSVRSEMIFFFYLCAKRLINHIFSFLESESQILIFQNINSVTHREYIIEPACVFIALNCLCAFEAKIDLG